MTVRENGGELSSPSKKPFRGVFQCVFQCVYFSLFSSSYFPLLFSLRTVKPLKPLPSKKVVFPQPQVPHRVVQTQRAHAAPTGRLRAAPTPALEGRLGTSRGVVRVEEVFAVGEDVGPDGNSALPHAVLRAQPLVVVPASRRRRGGGGGGGRCGGGGGR